MNGHTNVQIIEQGGEPAFAVVPYSDWLALTGGESHESQIPHEVMGFIIKEGATPIDAWRRYKKMTQAELGARMGGLSQAAVSQLLRSERPQKKTLERTAKAMGISLDQLDI